MAPKSWYLLISSKGWIKATDTYCTHAIECRRYLALTLLLVYLLHGHSLISARFAKIELILFIKSFFFFSMRPWSFIICDQKFPAVFTLLIFLSEWPFMDGFITRPVGFSSMNIIRVCISLYSTKNFPEFIGQKWWEY